MILTELENYLEGVTWHGDYLSACCVFHEDNNPSMLVFDNGFKCLSCNERGSLQKLLTELNRSDFVKRDRVFSKSGTPWGRLLSARSIPELAWDAHQLIKRNPSQGYYLRRRGIAEAIDELRLGWMEGYYFFPILSKTKQVIGLVIRGGESIEQLAGTTYLIPPDQPPMLYVPSWKLIEEQEEIRLVYGIIDAITLFLLGKAVVTGSAGKFSNPELLDSIRKPIIIIPDHNEDEDGLKLASNLGWRGKVNRILYPEDSKDCNDLFLKHGEQYLLSVI